MRSKEEIQRLVEGFAKSGMTRREYCAEHSIGMSTLDYWRRAQRKRKPKLVRVAVEEAPPLSSAGFALVLANGRRIESSWSFAEADLQRLIRTAEA
jgi:transposase-like protein